MSTLFAFLHHLAARQAALFGIAHKASPAGNKTRCREKAGDLEAINSDRTVTTTAGGRKDRAAASGGWIEGEPLPLY